MQRLTYSPKCYAFVYSSTLKRIVNLTEDIVSGGVSRKVNDFSTARITLRNLPVKGSPRGKYTQRFGKQVFLPNDLITIWLQRVAGKPIQVFTGYLDEVPMFEMYPRVVELTATCTLKRLAYGWFDPGLEFFSNWANGNADGWSYNPTTGEAINPSLNFGIDGGDRGSSSNQPTEHTPKSLDGGFARLLHEFMTQIAGWDQRRLHISNLDSELPEKAAALYARVNTESVENQTRLARAMREMMGVSLVGNKDGVTPLGDLEPEIMQVLKVMQPIASRNKVPLLFMVFAAFHQTAFDPAYSHGPETGGEYGYGIFKRRPDGVDPQITEPGAKAPPGATARGVAINRFTVASASEVFAKDAADALKDVFPDSQSLQGSASVVAARNSLINSAGAGDEEAVRKWMNAYLSRFGNVSDGSQGVQMQRMAHDLTVADTYVRSLTTGKPVEQPGVIDPERLKVLTWESPELIELLDFEEQALVRDRYKTSSVELVPYLFLAKTLERTLNLGWHSKQKKGSLYITGTTGALNRYFDEFKGHKEVSSVKIKLDGILDSERRLVEGESAGFFDNGGADMLLKDAVRVVVKEGSPPPDWVGLPVDFGIVEPEETETEEGLEAGFKFEDLGRFTANAALAAKYAFPVSYIESHFMTGSRSLQNDIPVMDGVKQFCQASLRNYMSLPDGSFLAFYPDYFGSKRRPYWWIPDIEIIDMRIQLNDRNLATHVFVTGDTFNKNDAIDEWDRILTRGVVTINDVALVAAMMDPGNPAIPLDPQKFLNHYGARPIAEENPLIRNPFYEFLMAWQRFMQLWATQFATSVDFTFQPEVMAGGLIGFPEHHLQMYVEEVEHTFAYDESGFNTTAVLSAPSTIVPEGVKRTDAQFPGLVPAGAANTVGAA